MPDPEDMSEEACQLGCHLEHIGDFFLLPHERSWLEARRRHFGDYAFEYPDEDDVIS